MATIRATTVSDAARPTRTRSAPGAVQGPGEHLVAGLLGDRQRLAGDRGLIHLAGPVQDLAVRADPLPGAHQHHVPDLQARRLRQLPRRSAAVDPDGLVRGQVEQAAVSHQLRLLRNLGLVTGTRSGKSIIYSLYDDHVAMLLDQAVYHIEHLRLGISDAEAQAAAVATV